MISTTQQPRQTPNLCAYAFRRLYRLLCGRGNNSRDSSRSRIYLRARHRVGCSSLFRLVSPAYSSERILQITYSCGSLDRGRSEHDISSGRRWRCDEAAACGADARGWDGYQVAGDGRITSGHFRDSGECALRLHERYD
jgi:hypothetical protein